MFMPISLLTCIILFISKFTIACVLKYFIGVCSAQVTSLYHPQSATMTFNDSFAGQPVIDEKDEDELFVGRERSTTTPTTTDKIKRDNDCLDKFADKCFDSKYVYMTALGSLPKWLRNMT